MERRTRLRLSSWVTISALLFCVCGAIIGQSSPTYTGVVSGHVYCADTNTPCRFATVNLQSVPHKRADMATSETSSSHSYSADTDLNGAFRIQAVSPGQYNIQARYAGYVSGYEQAVIHGDGDLAHASPALTKNLERISVANNQTTVADVTLQRGAAIEGTVRYDDGAPAVGIPFRLFRKSDSGKWVGYNPGAFNSATSIDIFAIGTDDSGHYREAGLTAGSYVVEVRLRSAWISQATINGGQSIIAGPNTGDELRVFSGDKYWLEDATPVKVTAGEDVPGVDIDIPTVGLHSISGTVAMLGTGESVTHGEVLLLDPKDKKEFRIADIHGDGSFEFNLVPPGNYLVRVVARAGGTDGKPPTVYAPLEVPMDVESDITNLTLNVPNTNAKAQ